MRILIVGANGQLGTDLCAVARNHEVIGMTIDDCDIRQHDQVQRCVTRYKPDVVVNTAAYNNVDAAEDSIPEVCETNIQAVYNLVEHCLRHSIKLVHISSDYVFGEDKQRSIPYTESDREGPINVYGITKLAGEYCIRSRMRNYIIVRTCGLFGVAGALGKGGNFVETIIRLGREQKEVKVVDDQIVSPTATDTLATQIIKLIDEEQTGIFHAVSEGECSWYDFTEYIYALCAIKTKLIPCTSQGFKSRAARPGYSVLDNKRLKDLNINIMDHWKDSVRRYCAQKGHLHEE